MKELTLDLISGLRSGIDANVPAEVLFANTLGDRHTAGGFWRFFSSAFPLGGLRGWNSGQWRQYWPPMPPSLVFVGEDLFGNQLVFRAENPDEEALMWGHEDGELYSLEIAICPLLETVIESGINWLDFYSDGSPQVGLNSGLPITLEKHLHWINPLILGGPIAVANLALVEREAHLMGHGKLWSQIRSLPPGTEVV